MKLPLRLGLGLAVAALVAGVFLQSRLTAKDEPVAGKDAALERTRKTVRMLDDIYKSAVVLITEKYVNSDTDYPAGLAAKVLFGAVKKKGWHDARLVDLSGDPLSPNNVPNNDFEKEAGKQLLAGQASFEKVVEKDNQRHLLTATPVPVVMKKCVMCHPNYADVKAGTPIGMISYSLLIE